MTAPIATNEAAVEALRLSEPSSDSTAQPAFPIASIEQVIAETLTESKEAVDEPYIFAQSIRKVAVIGAGPAGLPTARALHDYGLDVRVFERNAKVGGIWVYAQHACNKPNVPNDKLVTTETVTCPSHKEAGILEDVIVDAGTEEAKRRALLDHAPPSPCYRDLFNNTALCIMQFEDFPFVDSNNWYVSHSTIQTYYENYARHHGLNQFIELNTAVERVELNSDAESGRRWRLTLRKVETLEDNRHAIRYIRWQETFDAVAVASGAYQIPYIPDFENLREYNERWPERIMHSKQYRKYEDFVGKNVLLVGSHVSAVDIGLHLAEEANKVYMSIRGDFKSPSNILNLVRSVLPDAVIRKPNIKRFSNESGQVDGTITFVDGTTLRDIDYVIFCTGYAPDHSFFGPLRAHIDKVNNNNDDNDNQPPKAEMEPLVITDGKNVFDRYRDIFLIRDPTLAFVGMPTHLTSTGLFHYQGQAVGRVWSGLAYLPSTRIMQEFMKNYRYPYPPFDMSIKSERLHAQRLVTWLNDHAERLKRENKPSPPMLKGVDPELENLWDEMVSTWPQRSREIIAKMKNSRRAEPLQ